MLFLWIKIKNAAFIYLSANNKKEKIDRDLWPPECEMDRILSNREHFASHRIQNGTEMTNCWMRATLPNGVASPYCRMKERKPKFSDM